MLFDLHLRCPGLVAQPVKRHYGRVLVSDMVSHMALNSNVLTLVGVRILLLPPYTKRTILVPPITIFHHHALHCLTQCVDNPEEMS